MLRTSPAVLAFLLWTASAVASDKKTLDLTVTDPDGKPAAAAKVNVNHGSGNAKLKTDDAGRVQVEYPTGTNYLSVSVDGGKATVPVRLSWNTVRADSSIPAQYALALEPGTKIGGRVIDDAGQPVAGASVVLHVRTNDKQHPERHVNIIYKTLKSKADGSWSYARLPAKLETINIGVHHHRYASTFGGGAGSYPMNDFKPIDALRDGSATLTLKRGALIDGVVLGSDGKPLADAKVGIGRDRVASNVVPEVKTDAQGKFAIAAHPAEGVVLTVKAKGHAPQMVQFGMPAEGKQVKVEMKPPQTIAGRVVDPAGKPVGSAWIWVETWNGARTLNATLNTDAEGKFTWPDAPADAVQADASADGYARSSDVTLTPGADNVITLIKPAVIRGTVVDAETNQPIPSFKLVSGIDWGNGQPVRWQRRHGLDERQSAGKDGKFELTVEYPYPGHALLIEADGYLPGQTPVFKIADGDQSFEIKLRKAEALKGRVVDAQGKGSAGVDVVLVGEGQGVSYENGARDKDTRDDQVWTTSGADGSFTLPPQAGEYMLIASGDAGYVETDLIKPAGADAGKPIELKLQPWGKIEGVVMIGTKPAEGAKVQTWENRPHREKGPNVHHQFEASADGQGRFTIARVKPGELRVGRYLQLSDNMSTTSHAEKVVVKAGETLTVKIGGKGRPVVGRLDLPAELREGGKPWMVEHSMLSTKIDPKSIQQPPVPADVKGDPQKMREWHEKWMQTEEGKAFAARQQAVYDAQKNYSVRIERTDGSFRVEDVEPGTYTFGAAISEPPANGVCGAGDQLASAGIEVTVPEVPGGVSDEPLQVPSVPVTMVKTVRVGDAAPDWEAKTLDGKPLKLSDFKGKYVLLDFWATWCGPCVAETPNLKAVYDAFGADERFAMVALSLDQDVDAPKKYAEKNGLKWVQGFLGSWSETKVPSSYGVRGIPSMWLIGPDGKVIAKGLRGPAIEQAVRAALAEKRAAAR